MPTAKRSTQTEQMVWNKLAGRRLLEGLKTCLISSVFVTTQHLHSFFEANLKRSGPARGSWCLKRFWLLLHVCCLAALRGSKRSNCELIQNQRRTLALCLDHQIRVLDSKKLFSSDTRVVESLRGSDFGEALAEAIGSILSSLTLLSILNVRFVPLFTALVHTKLV